MLAQACLEDEEKLLDFKRIFTVNLGHRIPFRLMFFSHFCCDWFFIWINQSRLSQRLCIKFSNQRLIFESGDLQHKRKKRSSSVNKGFLWAHTLFVRIIYMEGGVTIEEVNHKWLLNSSDMYIGLFYQWTNNFEFQRDEKSGP